MGGWIDTPNQRLAIQHVQPIISPNQLAEVALADKPLRLKDVAKVVEEHPPLIGDAIIDGGPGLLMVIERFPNSDALEVLDGVESAIDELRQGLPGIEIDTSIFRSNTFIETASPQSRHGAGSRWPPPDRCARRLVPLVARRVDQHRRHCLVAGDRRAGAFPAQCTRQHHGCGRPGGGPGGGHRRCRHPGRQHPAASAPVSQPGRRQVGRGHYFRGLRRASQPPCLRHADHRAGGDARLATGRVGGGVLRSLCRLLYAGAAGLDGGRPDRHAGPRLAAPAWRSARSSRAEACAVAPGSLRQDCRANRWRATPDVPRRRPCRAGRSRRVAPAKLVAASLVQRA